MPKKGYGTLAGAMNRAKKKHEGALKRAQNWLNAKHDDGRSIEKAIRKFDLFPADAAKLKDWRVAPVNEAASKEATESHQVDTKGRTLYLPGNPELIDRYDQLRDKYLVPGTIGRLAAGDIKREIVRLDPEVRSVNELGGTGEELLTLLAKLELWDEKGELGKLAMDEGGFMDRFRKKKGPSHEYTVGDEVLTNKTKFGSPATIIAVDGDDIYIKDRASGMGIKIGPKDIRRHMGKAHGGTATIKNPDILPKKVKETRKPTVKESKLTEGVLDDMDDDGFMAKRQLYDLAKYSVELHRMIQDTDDLEPWVQAKITKAADYIDTVKHYMEYQGVRDADDTADVMGPPDLGDIDDVDSQLSGMDQTHEEIMEFGDEDEGSEIWPEDVLRWAVLRGIIDPGQANDPDDRLYSAALDVADFIGIVDEVGSSDVSIWMRSFVDSAKSYGAYLGGPKVDLYESQIQAAKLQKKIFSQLRGKK